MSEQHKPYTPPEIALPQLPSAETSGYHDTAEEQAFMQGVANGIRGAHALISDHLADDPMTQLVVAYEANRADLALEKVTANEHASRDMLTGLYNRKVLDKVFEDLQTQASNQNGHKRQGDANSTENSVLIIDVDHFKNVNDNYGHLTGDKILQAVAAATSGSVREKDVVVRLGGEEIGVILPGANIVNATKVAEIIRETIKNSPVTVDGASIGVTASIGVSEIDLTVPFEESMNKADMALYGAKKNGRDQTIRYDQMGKLKSVVSSRPTKKVTRIARAS
jgi:diguanylate cyclase (GGDEF)-like protein